MEPLTEENTELVRCYQVVATQITYDLHLAPMLFERLYPSSETSSEEFMDVMHTLNMIHTAMQRVAKQQAKVEAEPS